MWHVTHDTWHVVTRDTWHVTCLGGWKFSQIFSSLALTVCDLWYYEDLEGKGWPTGWINQLISDKAVYSYTGSVKNGETIFFTKVILMPISGFYLVMEFHQVGSATKWSHPIKKVILELHSKKLYSKTQLDTFLCTSCLRVNQNLVFTLSNYEFLY